MGAKGQRPDQVRSDAEINQLIADALPIAISDVTDLQTELNAKAETPIAIGDVTNLQTTLDGKATLPIDISDVTNLQTSLDDKLDLLKFLRKIKTANQTKNNNSTLASDDELTVSLEANSVYFFIQYLKISSGTSPDFKYNFTLPSGASGTLGFSYHSQNPNPTVDLTSAKGIVTDGTMQDLIMMGIVITTNAGTFAFQWAQNSAQVSDTIVYAGSSMLVFKQ